MAKSLEELIIAKRIELKYLILRESRLWLLGKRPVNKKLAQLVRHRHENTVWTSFMDSLNEDLTKNINIYDIRFDIDRIQESNPPQLRIDRVSEGTLRSFDVVAISNNMSDGLIVRVEQGELQGRATEIPGGRCFYSFQGIPYAKPPLGSLRFKAPQAPEPWEGVRDATTEGNVSAQIDPLIHKQFIGDENCLFLNVYTPNLDPDLIPVMIFIHGGGYKFGSGNTSLYGADYLMERGVVVVTINYRCGALGFLCLDTPEVPGNAGLKDMVQAIRWVKANIHNFGGDASNITLFGESAGGAAVSILTASPLTKDLISQAIIQSGTGLNSWAFQKNPLDNARELAKVLGCEAEETDEVLDFLSATSVREIVEANDKLHPPSLFLEKGMNFFAPVVEKEFMGVEAALTEPLVDVLTSGRTANVPVMIGSTTLEFSAEPASDDLREFIPEVFNLNRSSEDAVAIADKIKQIYFKSGNHTGVESLNEYYQLLSDTLVNVDTHRYVKYLVQVAKKPVFFYKFDYVGDLNVSKKMLDGLGLHHAAHMDELGYLFKNILQKDLEPSSQDIKVRERMLRLWTNFAKTGNPTPEENHFITVTWLPVTKDNLYYLNIGSQLSLDTNPDSEKMDFWEDLYDRYYKIWDHREAAEKASPTRAFVAETVPKEHQTTEDIIQYNEESPNTEELVQMSEEIPSKTEEFIHTESSFEARTEDVEEARQTLEETALNAEPIAAEDEKVNLPDVVDEAKAQNGHPVIKTEDVSTNGTADVKKARTSNEIKMLSNGSPKDVIRANDPPEDDLPKNIGVNKFVSFFEALGGKK